MYISHRSDCKWKCQVPVSVEIVRMWCIVEWQRRWQMQVCEEHSWWLWWDNFVCKGSGLRCSDVCWCGMIEQLRVLVVVGKIMRKYSDGWSEHGKPLWSGSQTALIVEWFGGWDLLFFSIYYFYCAAKKQTTLKLFQLLCCSFTIHCSTFLPFTCKSCFVGHIT